MLEGFGGDRGLRGGVDGAQGVGVGIGRHVVCMRQELTWTILYLLLCSGVLLCCCGGNGSDGGSGGMQISRKDRST